LLRLGRRVKGPGTPRRPVRDKSSGITFLLVPHSLDLAQRCGHIMESWMVGSSTARESVARGLNKQREASA
jgi:hypothetical protein